MPWRAMAKSSTPADHSLFLDYISPWNLLSLFRSLRASHFIVALAIAGTLLIDLLIVFSTGLFMPQITHVTHHSRQLMASTKLDGSRFISDCVDERAYTIIFGVYRNNLSYPFSTTEKYAYQYFNTSDPSVRKSSSAIIVPLNYWRIHVLGSNILLVCVTMH